MALVHAWWIAAPLLLAVILAATLPRIGVSMVSLLREMFPIIIACLAMASAVLAVQHYTPIGSPFFQLAWNDLIGAVVYCATFWFGDRALVLETWAMLRRRHEAATVS